MRGFVNVISINLKDNIKLYECYGLLFKEVKASYIIIIFFFIFIFKDVISRNIYFFRGLEKYVDD